MGITSSVGLFTGIDSAALIDQLLALDARPKLFAQNRIAQLQARQGAYQQINSALLGFESSTKVFTSNRVFDSTRSNTSNPDVITASSDRTAAAGNYTFTVDRLVTTQQRLTRGFADRDTSSFGAQSFTFESQKAALSQEQKLSNLNGGNGVSRGKFTITDKNDNTSTIDISKAVTLQDVVDTINDTQGLTVTAQIKGEGLVLTDTSGVADPAATITITDIEGGSAAQDLGIAAAHTGTTITSGQLAALSRNTALSSLNDGLGVMIRDTEEAEMTIQDRTGTVHTINLGRVVEDVLQEDWTDIRDDPPTEYTAGDVFTPPGEISLDAFLADIDTYNAGIRADNSALPPEDQLPEDELPLLEKPDTEEDTVQTAVATIGDLIDRIAEVTEGAVTLSIDPATNAGLVLTDNTGSDTHTLHVQNASSAATFATDIGLETAGDGVKDNTVTTRRLVAHADSVLLRNLNGGNGITNTDFAITDRDGNTTNISVAPTLLGDSLSTLLDEINDQLTADGNAARLAISESGLGLTVTDDSGSAGTLTITGDLATDLSIATDPGGVSADQFIGGNLQRQYINLATSVDDLNKGKGVGTGTFRITDAAGNTDEIRVTSSHQNLGDIINLINSRPNIEITASLNENGDGILLTDNTGFDSDKQKVLIEDESGNVAAALNIEGEFFGDDSGPIAVNGSYETVVTFDTKDTLNDAVSKINDADAGIGVTVINDGSGGNPFRLSFTSRESGEDGRVLFDTGGFDLGVQTITEGDDAVVFFGNADPARSILLTSSSNTLDNVIDGVTLDLVDTSDDPIEISIARDTASIENAVSGFVQGYNQVLQSINQLSFFNSETLEKGILFGDSTALNIKSALNRQALAAGEGISGQFQFLFQLGVTIGEGGIMEFDATKFRQGLDADFEAVQELFSTRQLLPNTPREIVPGAFVADTQDDFGNLGIPARFELIIDSLTNSIDGLLTSTNDNIDTQIDLQEDRIEQIDITLEIKRQRMQREFLAMEQSIGMLQNQASALTQFQAPQF